LLSQARFRHCVLDLELWYTSIHDHKSMIIVYCNHKVACMKISHDMYVWYSMHQILSYNTWACNSSKSLLDYIWAIFFCQIYNNINHIWGDALNSFLASKLKFKMSTFISKSFQGKRMSKIQSRLFLMLSDKSKNLFWFLNNLVEV